MLDPASRVTPQTRGQYIMHIGIGADRYQADTQSVCHLLYFLATQIPILAERTPSLFIVRIHLQQFTDRIGEI